MTQLYRAVCISSWNLTSLKHVQYLDVKPTEKICLPVKWMKKSLQPKYWPHSHMTLFDKKREGRTGCRQGDDNDRFLKEVQITLQYPMHAMNIKMYFQYLQVQTITRTLYYQRLFETFLSLGGFYYWGKGVLERDSFKIKFQLENWGLDFASGCIQAIPSAHRAC